jgi:hypothetical protein
LRKALSQARTEFASFGTSLPRITGYVDPAIRTANTIVSGFSAVKSTSSSAFNIAINDEQYAHAVFPAYKLQPIQRLAFEERFSHGHHDAGGNRSNGFASETVYL